MQHTYVAPLRSALGCTYRAEAEVFTDAEVLYFANAPSGRRSRQIQAAAAPSAPLPVRPARPARRSRSRSQVAKHSTSGRRAPLQRLPCLRLLRFHLPRLLQSSLPLQSKWFSRVRRTSVRRSSSLPWRDRSVHPISSQLQMPPSLLPCTKKRNSHSRQQLK